MDLLHQHDRHLKQQFVMTRMQEIDGADSNQKVLPDRVGTGCPDVNEHRFAEEGIAVSGLALEIDKGNTRHG